MDDTETPTQPEANGSSVIINLESLIKSHLSSISRFQEELKKHKEMLNDIFENDETYKKHAEVAKEAARVKSQTKQQIMKQPSVAELADKVKSMQSQLKETQGALSDYLSEYRRLSGISEIEDENGEIRQIIYVAKLVRR